VPYAIITHDKPGGAEIRKEHGAAHRRYLDDNKSKLIAAGAMLQDDATRPHGSIFIIDTDDRADAEAFLKGDPFSKAGLFADAEITFWRKAFFDCERLIEL